MEGMAQSRQTSAAIQRKILLTFALSSVIAVVLVAGTLRYVLQKAILDNWKEAERWRALQRAQRYDSEIAAPWKPVPPPIVRGLEGDHMGTRVASFSCESQNA